MRTRNYYAKLGKGGAGRMPQRLAKARVVAGRFSRLAVSKMMCE